MVDQCVILLVEDDENDAFFLKRALAKLGFTGMLRHLVDTESAREYLAGEGAFQDRARFPFPQIIIADSSVTVRESGVALLEWMRREEIGAKVPFIIFSGGLTDQARMRAEAAGARRILAKPSGEARIEAPLAEMLRELPEHFREWLPPDKGK